jgi:hypothetical protein
MFLRPQSGKPLRLSCVTCRRPRPSSPTTRRSVASPHPPVEYATARLSGETLAS